MLLLLGPHRFFHDWLKWTLRKQASRLFSRNFRWPWIHYVLFFPLLIFFCKQLRKKSLFWNWEGVFCCRFLFSGNRQLLYVWILIKQSQNTLSIFSQVYWPLWFCVQTSICSHVPHIDSFLPIFLWKCNGRKLDIKWGEMLLVSNSDHKRHLNYNNIVNRNCHSSKRENIRVLKMSIVQLYWKPCRSF